MSTPCFQHDGYRPDCADCRDMNGTPTWWEKEGLTAPCPNWRPETRRCNCKACRARRRANGERTRARPHVADPPGGFCPGCDDAVG